MEVQVEKTGPYLRKLSVTIPAGDVRQTFDSVYRKLSRRVSVPGFRPGKVPRGVLEARYGEEAGSEATTELIEKTLTKAMDDNDVAAVAVPKVDFDKLVNNADFAYTAEVEVKPEIELKQWRGLAAPVVDASVQDEEVQRELDTLRHQAAELVPVLIRDVVQEADVVLVDYEGTIGGAPFPGGKAEGAMVEIGGESTLPGFSEGLVGAKVPGERSVPVDFPDDYGVEALAGKSATFAVRLKEIKTKQVREIDDEFAKDMGEESLDALRAKIRAGIQTKKDRDARNVRRQRVLESLVKANPVEVPPSMVEAETDRMIVGAAQRVQRLVGEQFKFSPDDLQSLRADGEKDARFRVASGMLLLAIAEKEGLEVEESAVQAEVDKIAIALGDSAARVRSHYSDPDMMQELSYRLLEEKVVDLLLDSSVAAEDTREEAQQETEADSSTQEQPPEASAAPQPDEAAEPQPDESAEPHPDESAERTGS